MIHATELQRQQYFAARFLTAILLLLFATHVVDDYLGRRWDEFGFNIFQLLVVLALALYIRPERMRPLLCWVFATAILVVPVYVIAKGSGNGTAVFYMFFVPPLAIFFLGLIPGVTLSAVALAAVALVIAAAPFGYQYSYDTVFRFFPAYIILGIATGAIEAARQRYARRLEERTAELMAERQALNAARHDIRVLEGLLPICPCCKQIRRNESEWEPIETYVAKRSDADFVHTVCPACSDKVYPDVSVGR